MSQSKIDKEDKSRALMVLFAEKLKKTLHFSFCTKRKVNITQYVFETKKIVLDLICSTVDLEIKQTAN